MSNATSTPAVGEPNTPRARCGHDPERYGNWCHTCEQIGGAAVPDLRETAALTRMSARAFGVLAYARLHPEQTLTVPLIRETFGETRAAAVSILYTLEQFGLIDWADGISGANGYRAVTR